MRYRIRFSATAQRDLLRLYDYIADSSSATTARRYVDRIRSYCRGFTDLPERGTRRDDIASGTRLIGFERRVTIAFHIDGDLVVFDRILYGGRTLAPLAPEDD